jgi:hypothetical protein
MSRREGGRAGEDRGRGGEDRGRDAEDRGRGGEDRGRGDGDRGRGGEDRGRGGDDRGRGESRTAKDVDRKVEADTRKGGSSVNTLFIAHVVGELLVVGGGGMWLWKQIQDLKAKIDPVSRDNTDLAQYVSLLEANHAQAINAHVKALNEQQGTLQQQQNLILELQKQLEQTRTDLEKLFQAHNSLAQQHNGLMGSVGEVRTATADHGRRLGIVDRDLNALRSEGRRATKDESPPRRQVSPPRRQVSPPRRTASPRRPPPRQQQQQRREPSPDQPERPQQASRRPLLDARDDVLRRAPPQRREPSPNPQPQPRRDEGGDQMRPPIKKSGERPPVPPVEIDSDVPREDEDIPASSPPRDTQPRRGNVRGGQADRPPPRRQQQASDEGDDQPPAAASDVDRQRLRDLARQMADDAAED